MKIELDLDLIELNQLVYAAKLGVDQAIKDEEKYPGEYHSKAKERAKEVYKKVDEALWKACKETSDALLNIKSTSINPPF